MANPSVNLPDDMVAEIDERRPSTVSRSEWIRGAIDRRFELEDAGEWGDPDDTDSKSHTTPADD